MNRLNEEVLKDLNKIFVASEDQRELLLADLISKTSQEIQKEEENGHICMDLDLITGECVKIVNGTCSISKVVGGLSDFVTLACQQAFSFINTITPDTLKYLTENISEEQINHLLATEKKKGSLVKHVKADYRELITEDLKKGFKKGMDGTKIAREV